MLDTLVRLRRRASFGVGRSFAKGVRSDLRRLDGVRLIPNDEDEVTLSLCHTLL